MKLFPLIVMLVGAYVAARWLIDRRLEWRALTYVVLGVGLGLVINPYFPDNLLFILRHVGPKVADPTAVRVGNEWYPYDTTQLMEHSGPALALFMAGVLGLGLHNKRMSANAATALLVATLFGVMLFKSRRFVEYWPAFALIFGALAWSPVLQNWLDGKTVRTGLRRKELLAGVMIAGLAIGVFFNLGPSRESLLNSKPYQRYAGAATWLRDHTPQGSRVFQTDWDDFTRLFFYNTHNTYTLGLDPTYMQLHDAALFELWVDIGNGRIENPGAVIANEFDAAFAMTDLGHKDFLRQASADVSLKEVYRDQDAAVFQYIGNP